MARPLTTQFIKRRPRLAKPLELKKRPRPRRRQMQRKMVSVEARARPERAGSFPGVSDALGSLARPAVRVGRSVSLEVPGVEREALAEVIEGTKDPQHRIHMTLEMMDLDALDVGKYHAMVIQDPTDKRNIRGFFHLAVVHILTLAEIAGTNANRADTALARLIEALSEYTNIRADVRWRCDFDSPEVFKTPWIYAGSYRNFVLTDSEARNLGRYLTVGGFFFANEWIWVKYHSFGATDRAFKNMYREALSTQGVTHGRDWAFEELPHGHPIYHCHFDFDGPPRYSWAVLKGYPEYSQAGIAGVTLGQPPVGHLHSQTLYRSLVRHWMGQPGAGPRVGSGPCARSPIWHQHHHLRLDARGFHYPQVDEPAMRPQHKRLDLAGSFPRAKCKCVGTQG